MSNTRQNLIERVMAKVGDLGYKATVPAVSLASASGGSIGAGTYWLQVAALGRHGETLPNTVASQEAQANGKITFTLDKDQQPQGFAFYAGTKTASASDMTYQGSLRNWIEDQSSTYTITAVATNGREAVQDEATYGEFLPRDSYVEAAKAGLMEYSKLEPRRLSSTYTMTSGVTTYELPGSASSTVASVSASNWIKDFSQVRRIEWPAGNQDPTHLEDQDFLINEEADTPCWGFRYQDPTTDDTAEFYYIIPHFIATAGATAALTPPDHHFPGLAAYGAAQAAREYAGVLAEMARSDIGADVADRERKAAEFRLLGDKYVTEAMKNWDAQKSRAGAETSHWSYYDGRNKMRG